MLWITCVLIKLISTSSLAFCIWLKASTALHWLKEIIHLFQSTCKTQTVIFLYKLLPSCSLKRRILQQKYPLPRSFGFGTVWHVAEAAQKKPSHSVVKFCFLFRAKTSSINGWNFLKSFMWGKNLSKDDFWQSHWQRLLQNTFCSRTRAKGLGWMKLNWTAVI